MPRQSELERRIAAVDQLVRSLENVSDPSTRAAAQELVGTLMELHGAALDRILTTIRRHGEAGGSILAQLTRDEIVSGVLLLHDLHPVDLLTRVHGALEQTRPYLQSHGGDVELLGIDQPGVVRLRLQGSCHGCPSSAMTLKLAIEQAIHEAAPDVTAIVVEGQDGTHAAPSAPGLVTLEPATRSEAAAGWRDIPELGDLEAGGTRLLEVGGRELLFCRLDGRLYAYGARCPACDESLASAELAGHALACPACRQSYDVVHAGRAEDGADLHLDPFPLVTRNGRTQIATPPLRVAAAAG